MNRVQALEIEERRKRLKMTRIEILQLAREAAQNSQLWMIAILSKEQACDLIATLDRIERDEAERNFRRREAELVGAR